MKFLHIADVHIGATPDKDKLWGSRRTDEIYDSFKNIIKICEEQQVDLLLIAGDLFNAPPTIQQLRELDYQFRLMHGTKTVLIAGNHDYIEEGSPWETYKFQSDLCILPRDRAANVYIEDLNVCVTGFSYGKPEYPERILERLRPGREGAYNILLGHGGDRQHMPFSKEKLASLGFDYIALGHIHKPAHLIKNKMAFAGSLEPLDHTETGRRGYIMGELSGAGTTLIQWIPCNKRSYVNMTLELTPDIVNAEIVDNVEEEINRIGKDNIYKINLNGCVDSNLQINLSGLFREYNIFEVNYNTHLNYDMNELLTVNQNNLLGRFIQTLSDEDSLEDPEIRARAMKYGIEALLGIGEN